MIKVGICDDYKYIRESYRDILNMEDNISVIWTAESGESCLKNLRNEIPDILLLDIQLNTITEGIDILKEVVKDFPEVGVIMLTGYDTEEYVLESFQSGAKNFVLKEDSDEKLISVINNVYKGRNGVDDKIVKKLVSGAQTLQNQNRSILYFFNTLIKLTKTELEVLGAIAEGKSYQEISDMRFIEINTVRKIASNILKKFDAASMKELVSILKENGVMDLLHL